jgi:hypothetical protein
MLRRRGSVFGMLLGKAICSIGSPHCKCGLVSRPSGPSTLDSEFNTDAINTTQFFLDVFFRMRPRPEIRCGDEVSELRLTCTRAEYCAGRRYFIEPSFREG